MGFPHSSVSKESAYNAEDLGLIPGLGRSPEEGNWQSTSVSLPGKYHGQEPGGLQPMGSQESNMT